MGRRPPGQQPLRRALEAIGIRLDAATSTEEALDHLHQNPVDVIISDMGRADDPHAGYTLLDKMWSDVGIDAAAFQPNYFFEDVSAERIEDASAVAKRYGMGVEVEFDERMLTDDVFRDRYITYLNGGVGLRLHEERVPCLLPGQRCGSSGGEQ
ncbi:DUF4855 domain-containing protein [Actinopolymorpha sp. NPDC004070]|uniref:DUF4855 domain-containing protein n=1 Tax=Actinopolymorpha sp. NPDC004070 TaxID=3154548 RepID=UPI00339F8841